MMMQLKWPQSAFFKRAPELDPEHVTTLAYAVGSTLGGMPSAFFDEIATLARQMGPQKLAAFHARQIA